MATKNDRRDVPPKAVGGEDEEIGAAGRVNPERDEGRVSPALRVLLRGVLFDIDGNHYYVVGRLTATSGVEGDLLLIRGVEYMSCELRQVRRAIRIDQLEDVIAVGRVDIAFGPAADRYNERRGWRPRRRRRRPGTPYQFQGVRSEGWPVAADDAARAA